MPLDDLRLQLTQKVTTTARNTAREWESQLQRTGPSDTDNMNRNTSAKVSASSRVVTIEAKVDTPYAHIVRSGQRPHVITARPGGVLAFQSRGQLVFARSVNHPGARGNSWWDDAIRDLPDMLQRNWRGAR